jgi:hypothetical protein
MGRAGHGPQLEPFLRCRWALTFQTFAGRSIRMSKAVHDLHHMLVEVERRSPRTKVT